ncbi:hypothetical protein EIN_025860 [Entamoeba invadens IP1]|uniref:hypothetical protein n=1 Tax=Entamoeba invadens IP1 TaxID=370355 RepID=UPI0002C3CE6F|nr:hypothetical protein EIN_025860 [Entamoeba invadens IP1]ELP90747.1 hypothetical protein EIN_025860 [Entamoeba invadens IP1]|eukprot:XP_004257518.1 hypothetical protein EIN_025860 [Entamoeba invadens IP1]
MEEEQQILTLLQTLTCPCNPDTRQNAEQMLLNSLPRSLPLLLNIALNNTLDIPQRLLAAIVCKNSVLDKHLPPNDISLCVQQVMSNIQTCPSRIFTMLCFFLEALTRPDKPARNVLLQQVVQQLPNSLPILEALLCYTFIDSAALTLLSEKNGCCSKLVQISLSHQSPSALKILSSIISFALLENQNFLSNESFVMLPTAIIDSIQSDNLLIAYHALSLLRVLLSDAPHLFQNDFDKYITALVILSQNLIDKQQQNFWGQIVVPADFPFDLKDAVLISLVDNFSALAALDLLAKSQTRKINDIVTLVVRLLCSPTHDWNFSFDVLSHNAAHNVLQTQSNTLPEAGILFIHNIVLRQSVPVAVLFASSFQLLEQGDSLLQMHKRNFVNFRGTGLLILSICGMYLSNAHVHIQKEANALITSIIRSDFQLLELLTTEDFACHDIAYSLLCISSILPSATYQDMALFLSALSVSYQKLVECPMVLPYLMHLLTHCLTIQDFTISPFYTSFFSALLNTLALPIDEVVFVLDTLAAYSKFFPAAGTLFQPLVASILRCFLRNPVSPNVRALMLSIFTNLFNNRSVFLRISEFLFPPLPTVFAFCARQSSDYALQTALMLAKLIVQYSMALGTELKQLLLLVLSASKASVNCMELSVDVLFEVIKKYNNLLENEDGTAIITGILQVLEEGAQIGLNGEENLLKKVCSVLMLLSVSYGEKVGEWILKIGLNAEDKLNCELECVVARAVIGWKNWKEKGSSIAPLLLKKAVKMHDEIRNKGVYFGKIHGMYIGSLVEVEEVDSQLNSKGIPITIEGLFLMYLDLVGMEQIYNNERERMEENRDGNKMSDEDSDSEDDWDSDDGLTTTLSENHLEMSEALQNQELELVSRDDLFYSSYKDYLVAYFNRLKNTPSQRLQRIQQWALSFNKSFYYALLN